MIRRAWLGVGAAFTLCVGLAIYRETIPRLGSASKSEIVALVPAELRTGPPPDSEARRRFDTLRYLREPQVGSVVDDVEAILAKGPLQDVPWNSPYRWGETLEQTVGTLAERIVWAARTDDRATCAKTCRIALELLNAYEHAEIGLSDAEQVGQRLETIADAVEDAAQRGGLSPEDRSGLLRLVPRNAGEGVARAVRRDFRLGTYPRLIRAAQGSHELTTLFAVLGRPAPDPGTFDPLETTRLMVLVTQAKLESCRTERFDPHVQQAFAKLEANLPKEPPLNAKPWERFRYRWSANHSPNSLGRAWAVSEWYGPVESLCRQRTKQWNRIQNAFSPVARERR